MQLLIKDIGTTITIIPLRGESSFIVINVVYQHGGWLPSASQALRAVFRRVGRGGPPEIRKKVVPRLLRKRQGPWAETREDVPDLTTCGDRAP